MENLYALVLGVVIAILVLITWRKSVHSAYVMPGETGLLYGPKGFQRELASGSHTWVDFSGSRRVFTVPATTQALSEHMIEVISKDQFAFRVTLTPFITVTDARACIEQTRTHAGQDGIDFANLDLRYGRIWPAMSATMLDAVAGLTLDEFLAAPTAALASVKSAVALVIPGAQLDDIVLIAVTLPPEVRKMFTEVERARREGLAALERAKAEQASLRALANAARNLADNPALAQLRTLQVMENAKGAKTFVLGSTPDESGNPGS